MQRRDLGQFSQDHSPIGGYAQQRFQPEAQNGGFNPPQTLTSRQLRRAGTFILEDQFVDSPDMTEYEDEFGGYDESLTNPNLPVSDKKQEIKNALKNNRVVIITAETASGKTTQVPLMALEEGYTTTVTLPRRIATSMAADYMQDQVNEAIGANKGAGLIGYQTAGKSTVTADTRVSLITDGIAVNKLTDNRPTEKKTKLIFDEVHERNTNIDLALAFAKERLRTDPNLEIVIMSATVNAPRFANFFADVLDKMPPIIEAKGRGYPIEQRYEPDSNVVEQTIACLESGKYRGGQIFLPGVQEVKDTLDAISRRLSGEQKQNVTLLPLYAKQKKAEQDRVREEIVGIRIVASTPVGESSITIEGNDFVIDSGLERRIELDASGSESLVIRNASRASCIQRMGRTGRTAPGLYILTPADAKSDCPPLESRAEYSRPEILRTNVDAVVLKIAAYDRDIDTLDMLDKPDVESIQRSKTALYNLGALDETGKVTELGRKMASFPVRPSSARMLMEALPYSVHIQAQLAAIVSALEVGGLADNSKEAKADWREAISEHGSDLLAQLELFIVSQGKTDAQLEGLGLDVRNVTRARELYDKLVRRSGAWQGDLWQPKEEERAALKRAVYAGMINGVFRYAGEGKYERMSGGADIYRRERSNRSVIRTHPDLIVANPYLIEMYQKGAIVEKPIVESITPIDDLEAFAAVIPDHLKSWKVEKQEWREGRLKEVRRRIFNDCVTLPATALFDPIPSAENQKVIVDSLLENAGPAQTRLRQNKRRLYDLQQLTTQKIPEISEVVLKQLLQDATSDGVLSQTQADNNLRIVMQELKIYDLDDIISPEEVAKIETAAPREIVVGGSKLKLNYRRGLPEVTHFSYADLASIMGELYLLDGRQIMFIHGRQRMSLQAVQEDMSMLSAL